MNDQDRELLDAVLELDGVRDEAREAFEGMRERGLPLSPKQRAWASSVLHGDAYVPEPTYENLVSSGRVALGKPVATIPLLDPANLPKRPPGRRAE
jgi:hypothetical protein